MKTFREFLETVNLDPQNRLFYNPPNLVLTRNQQKRYSTNRWFQDAKERVTDLIGGTADDETIAPARSMNIPRPEMPQVKDREAFIRWLLNNNVGVSKVHVSPISLVKRNQEWVRGHAQSVIYWMKAWKFIKNNTLLKKLIILSSDDVIFDGNHHWLALAMTAPNDKFPMYKVDMTINKLLALSYSYPDVSYEPEIRKETEPVGFKEWIQVRNFIRTYSQDVDLEQ